MAEGKWMSGVCMNTNTPAVCELAPSTLDTQFEFKFKIPDS